MENDNFIERLAKSFSQNASVKNVYGDPIQAGDKTILPVASIAYGFGGGSGQGKNEKRYLKPSDTSIDENPALTKGSGGGGGFRATLKGVYEITPTSTRYIPANNTKQLLTGIAIGFLLKSLFFTGK